MATAKKTAAPVGLELEQVATSSLIPYASNSRTHSDEQVRQIAASIREFGFLVPILVSEDNTIIAGHGRLMAADKLGLDTVPVLRADHLTPAQQRAYVIADNKLTLNAGWDLDLLKVEIEGLDDLGFDIDLLGFSEDELKNILVDKTTGLTGDDEVPDAGDDPIAEPGDIWVLGDHRLICGDATRLDQMEAVTEGQPVDLLITDPPYNVDYTGRTEKELKIQNDAKDAGEFRQFLRDTYTACDAVMKPGAVFYIFHADLEGYNFRGAAADIGWQIRQCLVWNKHSMVLGRQDYQWKHEPCLYGWKDGTHLWASDRKQTTILDFDRPMASREHPTMKPVDLLEYLIENNTRGKDLVLDPFVGSGSTIIACEKLGRCCRAMELDPVYVDVAIRRWQDFTGEKATRLSDGLSYEDAAAAAIESA